MSNKVIKLLPYILAHLILFYILPFIIKDTGSAMVVMLVAIPVACFCAAVIYGKINSFKWQYPLCVAAMFAPTIFIFYNSSAWVYIPVYAIVAFAGSLIGNLFYKP